MKTTSSIGKRTRGSRAPGFTLIEILLALVLVGLISAMVFPDMGRFFTGYQLERCADDIAYVMRFAQGHALTHRRTVQLTFDEKFSQYWLLEGRFPDPWGREGPPDPSLKRLPGRMGRTFKVPEGVEVHGALSAVAFHPGGEMDETRIDVCRQDVCTAISTQAPKGQIRVYPLQTP